MTLALMMPAGLVGSRSRTLAAWAAAAFFLYLGGVGCRARDGAPGSDAREAAYRANNRGVALLERFAYEDAVAAFREAIALNPSLELARVNLPIALFYGGQLDEAEKEARLATASHPEAPQPNFILGLIARGSNRVDEAAAEFRRVLEIDPTDVGAKVNLALTYVQQRRFDEAANLARSALDAEPYNATAAYNLAMALTRLGDTAEGARAMTRFEELRTSGYAITYSQTYLEQGRYGEAIASTGAEPDLVNAGPSAVTFVDASDALLGEAARPQPGGAPVGGGLMLADVDRDGDLDLAVGGRGLRLMRNDGSRFVDVTGAAGLNAVSDAVAAPVAADVDNDDRPDLLALRAGVPTLFVQRDGMIFDEVPLSAARQAALPPARSAAFADVDHDGDLDLFVGGFGAAASRLLQNNGNRTFTDITTAAGLAGTTDIVALAPTDFDNRRDVDLLIASRNDRLKLFRNLRTGRFEDVAASVGLTETGAARSIAAGDVNKDGFTDFFIGRDAAPGVWALSNARGGFRLEPGPAGSEGVVAAQIADYDNDGLLDLIAVAADGPRFFRSQGRRWEDETARALPPQLLERVRSGGQVTAMNVGDIDLDGDVDIATLLGDGSLVIWRNEGGNRNRSLRVRLAGRVSNRSGVGAKVEMRAGSLHQRVETAATSPPVVPADIVFGLGARAAADAVRVLWPSGVLQAETELSAVKPDGLSILELDRKPSSCPYLFTWNGDRFEFVTDFLGGGEMGSWQAPGVQNVPEPVEYVRITDRQLVAENGALSIRVTNELEEALFLDHLELLAVTHPEDVMVVPDEGLRARPRRFHLYAVRNTRPPLTAWDDHDHDVLPLVAHVDRRYPDDFALLPVRGYAGTHSVRLTLGPSSGSTPRVLILTGWTDYAFSSDNVAAHQAGLRLDPPSLQVRAGDGSWRTVDADVGFPIGRPQALVVDVSRVGNQEIRLSTTMRVYWDQILVADAPEQPLPIVRVPLKSATLRWRGFSAELSPDGREPFAYDYHRVALDAPWKLMPGRYTREGDVRELMDRADDRFVVSRPGDEIAVSFDATGLPASAGGARRTFLLHSVGYSKEMNFHSASPLDAAPLPFRGMSRYPYGTGERYPHPEDVERFHTRVVTRSIPPLTFAAPSEATAVDETRGR